MTARCPKCNRLIGPLQKPVAGRIVVCARCRSINRWVDKTQLTTMTRAELAELPADVRKGISDVVIAISIAQTTCLGSSVR